MKILFIGDVTARIGRHALGKILPDLKKELDADLVILNCENASTGQGMTEKVYNELLSYGVDFMTSGNHIWRKKDFISQLDSKETRVIRPANYPSGTPGRGYDIIEVGTQKVAIINLLGLVFLNPELDSPFKVAEDILNELKEVKIKLVDFHAEITSEKVALGLFLSGKVSAVFGTHTHVPTADARVTDEGTALVTDVGMVGPKDSVLGVRKDIIIGKFMTALPAKHEYDLEGVCSFCAVLVEIDRDGKAKSIERIDREVEV